MDMRIIFFLLLFCLPVIAGNKDSLRSVNLDALEFEFFPCTIKSPIIKLNHASLKKYTDSLMIIKHGKIKYMWKNKSKLFREKQYLGCYKILSIRWNFGYQLFY